MVEYYMLPKLIGFSETAWSAERDWETIQDRDAREIQMEQGWNTFANTLAQRELPRLSYLNSGYNYRIPMPGAIMKEGKLFANVELPGLMIRYTTDGSEPDENSTLYAGPVQVSGRITLKTFDASGKSSQSVNLSFTPKADM
jgi:hexosaminidase